MKSYVLSLKHGNFLITNGRKMKILNVSIIPVISKINPMYYNFN